MRVSQDEKSCSPLERVQVAPGFQKSGLNGILCIFAFVKDSLGSPKERIAMGRYKTLECLRTTASSGCKQMLLFLCERDSFVHAVNSSPPPY